MREAEARGVEMRGAETQEVETCEVECFSAFLRCEGISDGLVDVV